MLDRAPYLEAAYPVSLSGFEREIIRELTQAGLQSARARGRTAVRRKVLTERQVKHLRQLAVDKDNSVEEICQTLGISRKTFYRYVNTE